MTGLMACRSNLTPGDAPNVMITVSTIKELSRFHTMDFYAHFADANNFSRAFAIVSTISGELATRRG